MPDELRNRNPPFPARHSQLQAHRLRHVPTVGLHPGGSRAGPQQTAHFVVRGTEQADNTGTNQPIPPCHEYFHRLLVASRQDLARKELNRPKNATHRSTMNPNQTTAAPGTLLARQGRPFAMPTRLDFTHRGLHGVSTHRTAHLSFQLVRKNHFSSHLDHLKQWMRALQIRRGEGVLSSFFFLARLGSPCWLYRPGEPVTLAGSRTRSLRLKPILGYFLELVRRGIVRLRRKRVHRLIGNSA